MKDKLTHKQRLERLLAGQEIDRPPVSAWRHFFDQEWSAAELLGAMLAFQKEYEWDFMKINPRASYYVEGWGTTFRYSGHPEQKPILIQAAIRNSGDWSKIRPLDVKASSFGEQLKTVDLIVRSLEGSLDIFQTVFSPLSIAADLTATDDDFKALLVEGENLESALEAIARTLIDYINQLFKLGISGIFFATTEWATRDNLCEEDYLRYGRPYDLMVLESARAAKFNILHVCKKNNMLALFKNYPVDILSWNKFEEGNLDFAQADKIFCQVFLGGVDQIDTLLNGRPEEITAQVGQSIGDAGGHPLIIGPGCALKMGTPAGNLGALRKSVY